MSEILAEHPADIVEEASPPTVRRRSQRSWPRRVTVTLSAVVVAFVLGWAAFPSVFAGRDPLALTPRDKLQGPSPEHWFGTDNIGRDVYTRVVHGAGLSLSATLTAVGLALVVGAVLGLLAGAVGGVVDSLLMRVVDVLLSIPTLLLSLALVTALGFGTVNVSIAVGVTLVASFARVMRSEVLRVRRAPYVEAAFASGARWPAVLVRHILRNSAGTVLALAAAQFGLAILLVSALSFLGFGAIPPTPEWGSLVSEGRNFLATAWWMTTMPGLVIVVVVLSAHRLGRAVEERS